MTGVDDGRPLGIHLFDAIENRRAALRIDRHGRFIEEDELRTMRDAASYIEAPQKTPGKLLRTRAGVIFKPDEFDGTLHQLLALCRI